MITQDTWISEARSRLRDAQKLLIGIGAEWEKAPGEAYEALYRLVEGRDYFIVTTLTDGRLWESAPDRDRIVAPCGNVHWLQCKEACRKDIWEEGELVERVCPHCGAPLVANTIQAENYIEEGYLSRWEACKKWQTATLNRRLVVLELGEDFKTPTVMRWPFEKIVFFNRKACLYRIGRELYQTPGEIGERGIAVAADSVSALRQLAEASL